MALMQTADVVSALERDLRAIFGQRLQSMVVYGQRAHAATDGHGDHAGHETAPATHTLAVVDSTLA